MDESALKTLLASLDASRSTLHWWLEFWTFLVVAGVALEVVFVVWEYRNQLHDFKRGIVHPPEKPGRLLFVLGLLGAALVAIGVAGELYEEAKIETVETRIRRANDEIFSLLSRETGDAKASADGAANAASRAKERAKQASKEAARLDWYIYAVMKQINPRHLNFDTKLFVDFMKGKPKGTAEIWYVPDDLEAAIFANEIQHALGPNGAGWEVPQSKILPPLRDSDLKIGKETTLFGELRLMASEGLSVAAQTTDLNLPDSAGRLFIDALNAGMPHISFGTQSIDVPTLPKGHVVIVVGHHDIRVPLLNFGQPKQ